MAVKLAERGIEALITCLKTNLGTEIAALNTNRGDSITLATPAAGDYVNRKQGAVMILGASGCVIEVYEEEFEFVNRYIDPGAQRFTYDLPFNVRVTVQNINGDTPNDFTTRVRRYATAVAITVNVHWDVDDSDEATKIQANISCAPPWDAGEDEDGGTVKMQTVVTGVIRCEETYT